MNRFIYTLAGIAFACASTLMSCTRDGSSDRQTKVSGDTITAHADLLTLVRCDRYTYAEICSPWNDSLPLGRYTISDAPDIEALPGTTLIRRPLQHSVVFSSVHTAPITELGSVDGIVAVADGSYFTPDDTISLLISDGKIADIGSSMSPSLEKIIDLAPDAVLLSPYENGSCSGIDRTGVPLIYMADYLEAEPLARAEWILLLGELYGRTHEADSIYAATAAIYTGLKERVANSDTKPRVLTEKPYSGIWYVPGGSSYAATILADAGAIYPWAEDPSAGSLPLDEAAVIDKASDADRWIIKDARDYSRQSLLDELPHARAFKAFPNGVYYCNTAKRPFFNAIAFHPELVLADYLRIFHPEVMDGDTTLLFFTQLK